MEGNSVATITIYGASDDLVEIEIRGEYERKCFEADAYDRGRTVFLTVSDGTGMRVYAEYSPTDLGGGVWMIGVAQLGEDQPIPDWPMKFRTAENGYSPELVIKVPEDVTVSYEGL